MFPGPPSNTIFLVPKSQFDAYAAPIRIRGLDVPINLTSITQCRPDMVQIVHITIATNYRPSYASSRTSLVDFFIDTLILPFVMDEAVVETVVELRESYASLHNCLINF